MNRAMQPQNHWRLMPSPKCVLSGAGRRSSRSPTSACCAFYGDEFSALAPRETSSTELSTMISSTFSPGYNNYVQSDSITKIDCNAKNGYYVGADIPKYITPIRSDEPSHGPLKKRRLRADTLEQARLESFPTTVTPVPRINAGNTIAINEHFSSITRAASFIECQKTPNNPPFGFMSADPYSMILQAPQLIPYPCATKKEVKKSDSRKETNTSGRSESFSSSTGGTLYLPIPRKKMPIRPTRLARPEDAENVIKLHQFVQSDLLRPTRLARPEDTDNVNKLHQFVRSDLLEIFEVQNGSGSIFEGRVGLRCTYCKHTPKDEQSTGAVFYPRNIHGLYRNVCTWQRVHFKNCKCMPEDVRQEYNMLKIHDKSRGKTSYWDLSARLLGLQDTEQNDGRVGVKFI